MGMRLLPANSKDPVWFEADLAIANKHPGLEEIFKGTEWAGTRWSDALHDLEFRRSDGSTQSVAVLGQMRYGGPSQPGVGVPAEFLPSLSDEGP